MVSIIIPTHNDTSEIGKIINVCKKLKFEKEIIVVDDGSEKEHKDKLKKLTGINLITHEINKGKSNAMLTGLKNATGEIVGFLDADIIGLTVKNLNNLILPIIDNEYDITLSEKGSGLSKYGRYTGIAQTFTGERFFKKELLAKNLDIFESEGYTIEAEMNKRFFNKVKIARTCWPNVENPSKVRKGNFNGIKDDVKMYNDITSHIGIKELTNQIKTAITLPITNPEDSPRNSFTRTKLKELLTKEIDLEKILELLAS